MSPTLTELQKLDSQCKNEYIKPGWKHVIVERAPQGKPILCRGPKDEFFEDRFPTLNGREHLEGLTKFNITYKKRHPEEFIPFIKKEDVDKYCLDKQRVRDVIMRLPNDNRRYILMKELGL